MNKKLFIAALFCAIPIQIFANTPSTGITENGYSNIQFVPKRNSKVSSSGSIDSVEKYSPTQINRGWITLDHIGYKDTAFQGERHIAFKDKNVQFFGYDSEGLTDMMLLPHTASNSQVINMLQAPIRADWHTLDGNGLMFGVEVNGTVSKNEYNLVKEKPDFTISGYSVVATSDSIEVRQYTNVTPTDTGTFYKVLYKGAKSCPSQNFTVDINGNKAKVFLGNTKLTEINITTKGRWTGIIATYKAHGCNSLSSVNVYNHTVNEVNYLNPITVSTQQSMSINIQQNTDANKK